MDQTAVVYYYADPAFRGDIAAPLKELGDRGYRVVRGDNADELLFLLQVGRPAAVIYTLSTPESITSAAFQMVSRRAFDLLVPIIAVGPEDPRDGVTLVIPEGRKSAKRHVPFHSFVDMIVQFDREPPSTPSRPPEAIKGKTVGKGRTLLSWQPPPSVVEQPPPSKVASKKPVERPPSDKRTLQMSAAAAEELAAAEGAKQPASETVEPDKRTLEMSAAAAAAKKTTPEIPHKIGAAAGDEAAGSVDPVADSGVKPRLFVESSREIEEPSIRTLMHEAEVEATARTTAPSKPRVWRVMGPLLAVAALGAVGAVIYLATRPGGPPPQPLRHGDVTEGRPTPPLPAPPEPAPAPPEPAPAPTPDEVEPTPEELAAALPLPVENLEPGRRIRFPAHFRPGTATFWYSDPAVEEQLLAKVKSLGPGRTIHIVGHPTEDEVRAKNWAIGLSRAWAVEKYLIRNGVDPESIETSRGPPIEPRDDMDERGWLRNRWVDIEVE